MPHGPNWRIRACRPSDHRLLPGLERRSGEAFRQFGYDAVADMVPTPAEAYATLPAPSWVFVAQSATAPVVGFCVLGALDAMGHVREMGVDHRYAGQGIGTALLERGLDALRAAGFRAAVLTTFADLPFNAPYYRRLGFEEMTPDPNNQPGLHLICQAEKTGTFAPWRRVAMCKTL